MTAAVMCMNGAPAAALAEESGESAMGRYLETEVVLPEDCYIRDVAGLADGRIRIIGESEASGMTMWDSSDGGANWEQMASLPEEYADVYFANIALDGEGGGAGITMESGSSGAEGSMADYEFNLVSFDAEGNAQKAPLPGGVSFLEFASNGELLNFDIGGGVSVLDRETGETVRTVTDLQADAMGCCGNEVLLLTESEAQRFDLGSGEPLERDEALNEALFAGGSDYGIRTTAGFPIAFAQDEDGRLYYCTNQGIFSHVTGGSVVEQIVDGTLNALSSPEVYFVGMIFQNQSFYVLYVDGSAETGLLKYEYSPDISSVPEREMTIYSLEDNDAVRQAAVQFQKMYPDTYVTYRAGMSGEDGVTAADALRTLNTDILAGNGPDILVLDDMSVKTYAEKGLLEDLSEIVSGIQESDGVFENIANAFEEEGTLPAVPARFSLEAAAGDPEAIAGIGGLSSLEELAGETDALSTFNMAFLPEFLYPVCAGSWKNADNTIDQEKLEEFVSGVKAIMERYRETASEESLDALQSYAEGEFDLFQVGGQFDGVGMGINELYTGKTKAVFGALGDYLYSYTGLMSVNHENGNCGMVPLSMMQSDVFLPSCILGVLTTAKEKDRAYEFVQFMLSAEGQGKSTVGLPVNRSAFDTLLSEDQFGEEGGYSLSVSDGENFTRLDYTWPTEEEQAMLKDMAEQASICADTEIVQRETVLEETYRCLNGEISSEEAVNSIIQKINLYLAEG